MRNSCKKCIYCITENNTYQSKKCATAHEGYITFFDRLFCEPLMANDKKNNKK